MSTNKLGVRLGYHAMKQQSDDGQEVLVPPHIKLSTLFLFPWLYHSFGETGAERKIAAVQNRK